MTKQQMRITTRNMKTRDELRLAQREEVDQLMKATNNDRDKYRELREKQIVNTMNEDELVIHVMRFPDLTEYEEILLFFKGERDLTEPLFKGVSGNHWGAWRS